MTTTPSRRASRMLRLYPRGWRQRYGAEFAALMEDELAERPRCSSRTLNVIRIGLTAWAADLGIAGQPIDPAQRVTTGLASTTCVGVIFTLAALHPWAFSMLAWNGWAPRHAGVMQTVTTGAMTVVLVGLVAVLSLGLIALVGSAVWRLVRHREWRLGFPVTVFVGAAYLLVVSMNRIMLYLIARGGIEWSHPGQALKQLAGTAYFSILSITGTTFAGHYSLTYDLWHVAPIVSIVAMAVSAGWLIRRLPFRAGSQRFVRTVTVALSALMLLEMASYVTWYLGANVHVFGGNNSFEAVAFIAMLVAGSVGVACARSTALTRRFDAAE